MLGAKVLHELFAPHSIHHWFCTVLFLFRAPLIAAQEKACPVDLPVELIDDKAG